MSKKKSLKLYSDSTFNQILSTEGLYRSHLEQRTRQSREVSPSNAWNVNQNNNDNANWNNNDKNNQNDVLACESVEITYNSLKEAYLDCRKNKFSKESAVVWDVNYEQNLCELMQRINDRTYTPGPSTTFIVTKPCQREVFAADYTDRIIHHWIALRLEPLLEKQLISTTYNCRKDKGTLNAIKAAAELIKKESNDYTENCYIFKLDLTGFFMSLDRRYVTDKVLDFINKRYFEKDKPILLFLVEKILMNSPEIKCYRKGRLLNWVGLSLIKSLFTIGNNKGLPIGNLTSQLVANFVLDPIDHFIVDILGLHLIRYVDDFLIVDKDKQKILLAIPQIRDLLTANGNIKVNAKKYYCQHYSKGVMFLGAIIMPGRIYLANRTIANIYKVLYKFNRIPNEDVPNHLQEFQATINSYLGMLRQFTEYDTRMNLIKEIDTKWWEYFNCIDYNKVVLNEIGKLIVK